MGFFDRFKSNKGKAATQKPAAAKGSKAKSADEAKQQAFANVPSGKSEAPVKAKAETPAKGEAPAKATAPVSKDATWEAYRLLLRPVVTEKSSRAQSQYTFDVPNSASKDDIWNAVFHVYGVKPMAVNMSRLEGRAVRYGRFTGRTKGRKKAMVRLPMGKTIDVFSA